jgi:hypothetical protein
MTVECIGGPARKLVDARFLRTLDAKERGALEIHLSACGFCTERYRKLQLAERVAASGAERAFDEPSPFEIDRIAIDLGLIERPRRRWAELLRSRIFTAGIPALAVATLIALVVVSPRALFEERPIERGESGGAVAAYVVSSGGAIRALDGDRRVRPSDYLKLRIQVADERASRSLAAIEVSCDGVRERIAMPMSGERTISVPGAIALAALSRGSAVMHVVGKAADGAVMLDEWIDLEVISP